VSEAYRDAFAQKAKFRTAKDQGYDMASKLRRELGWSEDAPISDLAGFVHKLDGLRLQKHDHNHLPSRNVSAVVGWTAPDTAIIAGPALPRNDSNRFLMSRGLYLALTGCREGARLLTRASTWDQQASRAFAAELLAPKEALGVEARADMDIEEREGLQQSLAQKYDVSKEVVRLQLANQGIWR
jgi:hypothetical protein